MKGKELTKEQQIKKLKRENIRLQIEIIVIFLLLLGLFFFNYNYTVFKILIAGNYTDTKALDSIYKDTLVSEAAQNDSSYYKNFDNVTISLFMDKLHETNGDKFTMLFNRGELLTEQNTIKEDSQKTSFKKLDDNTGCLTLTAFSSPTVDIVKDNLEPMSACKDLVIDLRNNGGGILKAADKTAEYFLSKDSVIAKYNYRSKLLSSTAVSKNSSPLTFNNIYILQNENTASAAEVFINALKENLDNVTIIGTSSYGKGIGQTEMKLLNGFGIKATTLSILTPKDKSINHTGIVPDIAADNTQMDNPLELIKQAH